MALLKIARMGHPVLRRVAEPVADPTAPEIHRLVADLLETMVHANGAGLAAPQVHVSLRLVVFQAPADRSENLTDEERHDHTAPLTVLINPEIEILGPERESGWEGCLSVPGLRGLVERSAHIRYRAASITKAMPSTASPRAFTPVWCSMNAIISTEFYTRSGWAI